MASKLCPRTLPALFMLLACASLLPSGAQTAPQKNSFSVRDASLLLRQIDDGLVTRQAGKVLNTFDIARMRDGGLFRQQITSFLSHTDSIRMHFNVTSAAMDGDNGKATVDVEMEADSGVGNAPPLRKQATLQFSAEHTQAGWKFTDVQPRDFFSTSNAPARSAPPQ